MPAHRVFGAAIELIGLMVVGLVAGLIVGGAVTPAVGATFVIADGTVIDGRVIQATRNTVTLRVAIGGPRQLAIGQVREVRLTGADGRIIAGPLRGCAGRRCALEVGGELVWFEADRVVERTPVRIAAAPAPARADHAPAAQPMAAAAPRQSATATPVTPAPVAAAVVPAAAPARPDPTAVVTMAIPPSGPPSHTATGALPLTALPPVGAAPVQESPSRASLATPSPTPAERTAAVVLVRPATAAPTPSADGDPAAPPVVTVTTRPAGPTEASGEIVFAVELSRPLAESLVLIYATVDARAKAGLDYGARQGILTLPPGTTSGDIRTTVLDDAEPEGDEDFQLFLAADRAVTTIAEPWTRVTIQDDD